ETAPEVKRNAVLGYGAEVIPCKPTLEAREETLKQVVAETGASFVHPFDDYLIICGQATAALELIEEVKDLDVIVAPVGGGGLISGTALAAKYFGNHPEVFAAEPENVNDAYISVQGNKLVKLKNATSIADGLLTSLSNKTFEIITENVHGVITVSEQEIIDAMRLVWERMKIIIEPSSAVALAAVIKSQNQFRGKRVGIIFSGGNVDLKKLPF